MHGDARIGTSGFAQPELAGGRASEQELLAQYAQRLSTVEIASSFQRPPTAEQCAAWAEVVPPGFQFSLKLPRKISNDLRLQRTPQRSVASFFEAVGELGPHLGPLLVQLPPNFTLDLKSLQDFLRSLPRGPRLAFEFRHPSWNTPAALRLLSAYEAAVVLNDQGEGPPRIELTADFAYVRIRRDDDRPALWDEWAERLAGLTRRGVDVYAFIKHDRRGVAIDRARRLAALLRNEQASVEQSLLT